MHKPNCQCASCRSKRGEKLKHKVNCDCPICKLSRGELKGKDHPRYGKPSWCKGFTKETDVRIKERSKKTSEKLSGRTLSDEHKNNLSCAWVERRKTPVSKETREKQSMSRRRLYDNGCIDKSNFGIKNHDQSKCRCSFCRAKRHESVPDNAKKNMSKTWKKKYESGIEHGFRNGNVPWNFDKEFYDKTGMKKSCFPYNEKFNHSLKKKIRSFWGNRCVVTGMTNDEHIELYGRPLFIHHWNYDKLTDDPYFMLPVCQTINNKADEVKEDRESWMSLFGGIADTGVPFWY